MSEPEKQPGVEEAEPETGAEPGPEQSPGEEPPGEATGEGEEGEEGEGEGEGEEGEGEEEGEGGKGGKGGKGIAGALGLGSNASGGAKGKNGFSAELPILVGCLSFVLFSIIKCIDVSKSLMSAKFEDWASVCFNSSTIIWKILALAIIYLFVVFILTTLLTLFVVFLVNRLQFSDNEGKVGSFSAIAIIKLFIKLFMGFLTLDYVLLCVVIVTPLFFSIFVMFFAHTMWKPKKSSEEDNEVSYVQNTMKHYLFMLAIMLYFISIAFVVVNYVRPKK